MFEAEIVVVGLGYIGLPTAATLASKKFKVLGFDINNDVVQTINKGKIHIVEKDLETMVKDSIDEGFLTASNRPQSADVFIITVPTPFKSDSEGVKSPNIEFIEEACIKIAPLLKKDDLIILESTSPLGTTEKISTLLGDYRKDLVFPKANSVNSDVHIAYCPERVTPGAIVKEIINNNRVIGGITSVCTKKAKKLYSSFVKGTILETNARTAELCKLVENSFRDVGIGFANQLSMICEELDIDVWELINLANHHPRVNILNPGPGVGGHCIAVDPWFLVYACPDYSSIIRESRLVNDYKTRWVIEKIINYIHDLVNNKYPLDQLKLTFCGITFKANSDDLRESPSLKIVKEISKIFKFEIRVFDPYITELPLSLKEGNISLSNDDDLFQNTDILIMLVPHDEFIHFDENDLSNIKLLDFCGYLSKRNNLS